MTAPPAPAITSLYAAFARVPRPSSIEYCDCCFTPEEERALLADVPLQQLPVDALSPYAGKAPYTVGGGADFRHFLPRILEIACGEGFTWPDLESVMARLRAAGWHGWQEEERDAVRDFLAVLWAHTLSCDPDERDADTVLCAIGNAEDDLGPYLSEWEAALNRPATTSAAAAQLRSLLHDGYRSDRTRRRLTNAFWRDRPGQAEQVITWLSGAGLQLALLQAYDAAADEETLQILTDIDDLV